MVAHLASHPEAGVVRGLFQYWHGWTGNPADTCRDYVPPLGLPPNTLFAPPVLLTLSSPLGRGASPGVASVMVRREVIRRIGGFEEIFRGLGEDQVFYVKLYANETVFVTDECWFRYRQHPQSCCAVAKQTGNYSSLPLVWNWLQSYLHQHGINDPDVCKALRGWRLLPYRHPALYRLVKVLAERTLPLSVFRWLAAHW
jgi:hypothetical protein